MAAMRSGAGFRKAQRAILQATEAALMAACITVEGQAILNAPVDKASLRDSITWATKTNGSEPRGAARKAGFDAVKHDGSKDTGIIGATAAHAAHVEYGTAPHIITPKNGRALFWPGAEHPVKIVHHPGTAAQPFLRTAVDQTRDKLPMVFTETYRHALEKLRTP